MINFFIRLKKKLSMTAVMVLALLLVGCSVGPTAIYQNRLNYNIALDQTNKEQLLLNLVRLMYRDTPFFMETASVSSGFSFGANLNGMAALNPSAADMYQLTPGLSYSERPTITYTPLQGEKFVKQMLSPLNLNTLLLLYHSGWSIERLLRVTAQSINGIPNAPSASGPTPTKAPKYERFRKIVHIIRNLQQNHSIRMGTSETEGIAIIIEHGHEADRDVQAFKQMLNLDPNGRQFQIIPAVGHGDPNKIYLSLRSMLASMFYLSQAVEVPNSDRDKGIVTTTRSQSGEVFDWKKVTSELFQIRSASSFPKNAYVTIKYRGQWFYIKDNDLDSKSTFSLMTQLLALQSGQLSSNSPLLTLPVR
jgi:hypothetical protein